MITLIAVPYHLGQKDTAVGAGPSHVLDSGIARRLNATEIRLDIGPRREWREVNSALTEVVRGARASRHFPLVIAGNCNSCLGTLQALQDLQPGIVWFDAHGDFHTEETSVSGSIEGMSLALATTTLVREDRVILAGARDLDPGESERVHDRLVYVPTGDLRSATLPEMNEVYVHIDVDVLDPSISPGANFQAPGGLTPAQLLRAVAFTFRHYEPSALAIANYNPERDKDNRTRNIIIQLIENIVSLRRTSASR